MTMLETNTNGGKAGGKVLGCGIHFIQTRTLPSKSTGNLVEKHSSSKASVKVDFWILTESQICLMPLERTCDQRSFLDSCLLRRHHQQ